MAVVVVGDDEQRLYGGEERFGKVALDLSAEDGGVITAWGAWERAPGEAEIGKVWVPACVVGLSRRAGLKLIHCNIFFTKLGVRGSTQANKRI